MLAPRGRGAKPPNAADCRALARIYADELASGERGALLVCTEALTHSRHQKSLLTIKEAAEQSGFTELTIRNAVTSGELVSLRPGLGGRPLLHQVGGP